MVFSIYSMVSKILGAILWLLSGEFLLRARANGGGIILARTLIVSIILFMLAIGTYSWLDPRSICEFSWSECAKLVRSNIPWFGAVFGAVYAALYTRYSSQWQYLAGLYNQLMAAEDAGPRSILCPERRKRRALWWHAFIVDAQDVHLALKPAFASAILALLKEQDISALEEGTTEEEHKAFERFKERLKRAAKVEQVEPVEQTEQAR